MTSSGKVGIVTVTYNSGRVLSPFLASVSGLSYSDFFLYAIDNSSSDDTVVQLRAWGDPRLRLIANKHNVGVAEGNNQGTCAALVDGCSYVLYLNNDVEFEPDMLTSLMQEIETLNCEMLSPKILYEDRRLIWSAGGGFNSAKGYLGFHAGDGEIDTGQYDRVRRIEHSPTCCLLVRKSVFEVIGMMDPKYFVYHDDTDFSYRAWRAGLIMYYTPKARIFHKVSFLTGGADSPFSLRFCTRNHIYYMLKHLGLRNCFFLVAYELRLIYKVLSGIIGSTEFCIRQKAFFEGFRVWVTRP